jgi:hypothetical protein
VIVNSTLNIQYRSNFFGVSIITHSDPFRIDQPTEQAQSKRGETDKEGEQKERKKWWEMDMEVKDRDSGLCRTRI